jgi:hypothetical protein
MRILTGLCLLFMACTGSARTAQEYLPPDSDLDPGIPAPESVLGWNVGDWHVSHDKLVQYMQALAESSPRVSIKVIGYTYEQRPLLQVAITSEANQQKLETLRQAHLEGKEPLVVWLGYSVHGDEPSGSNASMLAAYYLAASRSSFVEELLAGSVILIDPGVNPDGLNRFASWANSNAGKMPVSDPLTRQHIQNWPRGRGNHYWFDLNRDWLPLVHPESRARIVEFHRWLPHVLTDHHEQGSYPGFFFQPGVPTRQNPLTPPENLELTRALAVFHSRAMDAAGQPHFTEDAFDDFYYGKGSTYPDINGGIGILFEQRAIRGQEILTSNGTETFRQAVANQLRMSLSTLKGAWELRDQLRDYQTGFYQAQREKAGNRNLQAWVVSDDADPARAQAFLEVLELHRIEYQPLDETFRSGEETFEPGHAWVIPARQRQSGLLEALMEQRTNFKDETFYDVSAWTLPLAYNLPFTKLNRTPVTQEAHPVSSGIPLIHDAPAWAIPWNQLDAPALLQRLLDSGAKVRTSIKPFSVHTANGLQSFLSGTLVIQAGIQVETALADILGALDEAAHTGLDIYAFGSTMTSVGPDLGSHHFPIVEPVKPLLIGGEGTSSYGAGEIWYLLDQRLELPAPIIELNRLSEVDLGDYTHLLLPDGDYAKIDESRQEDITAWVEAGGILIAVDRAAAWSQKLCFPAAKPGCNPSAEANGEAAHTNPAREEPEVVTPRAYSDFADDTAQQVIGGAIVASLIDLSHPLTFGYRRADLPLKRRGTTELLPSENAYSTPVRYTASPLMAGFIGNDRLKAIQGQAAVIAEKKGEGLVVHFANDPLFRGYWRGTERLYINALYLGQVVETTELPEQPQN